MTRFRLVKRREVKTETLGLQATCARTHQSIDRSHACVGYNLALFALTCLIKYIDMFLMHVNI